jgi:hypothetical protein
VPAELVQPSVGLGVDAGDEEARDRRDAASVVAGLDEPLEPADVSLGHLGVALEREDQGHVDRLAPGDHLLDRGQPGSGCRELDVEVGPIDQFVQALRFCN